VLNPVVMRLTVRMGLLLIMSATSELAFSQDASQPYFSIKHPRRPCHDQCQCWRFRHRSAGIDDSKLIDRQSCVATSLPVSEYELKADLQLSHSYVPVEAGNRAEAAAARDWHTTGSQLVRSQTIGRAAKVGLVQGIEGIEPQL
jgi:hypothetical protein